MSIHIKTWRDPYNEGFNTIKPKEIDINPGITVLVGCNGSGKTTLIKNIESNISNQNIPYHTYNNLSDGGDTAFSSLLGGVKEFANDNMELGLNIFLSSEGEAIKANIKRQSTLYNDFIDTGYYKNRRYTMHKIFSDKKTDDIIVDNRRVLLFDATDSGMSVDAVCELKLFLNSFIEYAKNKDIELYIIMSANEYELARNEQCFDVVEGKYLTFSDYEDYRNFILNSRAKKEKRIQKQIEWQKKKLQKETKEYEKMETKINEKIKNINNKASQENRELSWREKYQIDAYQRELKDFIRNCKDFTL